MSNTVEYADIFLDYAAGSPLNPEVLGAMQPYFSGLYRNPSSMHAGGRRAKKAMADAREEVARAIGAQTGEVIFTGSGTESDNLAIIGAARALKARGNHILVSSVEHKAVLEAAKSLSKEGFEVSSLPADRYGMIAPETVRAHLRDETILVSVIYANNELGTIAPIQEISAVLAKACEGRNRPIFHTDACQALSYLDVDVKILGVDLMTFNSAKLGGPTGIAALYVQEDVRLSPLIHGGEQERLIRPGTEALPLIRGFARAVTLACERRDSERNRLSMLRAYFIERLMERVPGVLINGHPSEVLSNIIHITVPGIEGEAMLLMLDEHGVAVSTGSACSAFDLRPSHVLAAIGQDSDLIHGSIRFSFGPDTTKEKLEQVLHVFPEIVSRLRSISSVTTHAYEMHCR
jgi:cysteine desulfurase